MTARPGVTDDAQMQLMMVGHAVRIFSQPGDY
jgi:hypothetical protein